MGDRCVIANRDKNLGVYLHWDGYREFVESALAYCDVKEFRSPDVDYEYGWARLCQVLGNTIGGTLSLGVGVYSRMDTDNWDNGTYIINGWDIQERLYQHYDDEKRKDLIYDDLVYINNRQPNSEKLEEEKLQKYAEIWEEKHLDRLKEERRKIVEERIKTKEALEKAQEKIEQDSTNEEQDVEKDNTKEKQNSILSDNESKSQSTDFDKKGKNSNEVNEHVIPYGVLKKNGITYTFERGDDR